MFICEFLLRVLGAFWILFLCIIFNPGAWRDMASAIFFNWSHLWAHQINKASMLAKGLKWGGLGFDRQVASWPLEGSGTTYPRIPIRHSSQGGLVQETFLPIHLGNISVEKASLAKASRPKPVWQLLISMVAMALLLSPSNGNKWLTQASCCWETSILSSILSFLTEATGSLWSAVAKACPNASQHVSCPLVSKLE